MNLEDVVLMAFFVVQILSLCYFLRVGTPCGIKSVLSLEDAGFVTAKMVDDLCHTGVAVSLSSFVSDPPFGLNCSSDA